MDKWTALAAVYQPGRTSADKELLASQEWLIRIRWIAGFSVLVATWVACNLFKLELNDGPLYAVGVSILVYNAAFVWWIDQIRRKSLMSVASVHTLALLQITADWIAMTYLVHRSGGVESPVILFFFLHIVLASMLLSVRATYLFAALGIILVSGTVLLEYAGIVPHISVKDFMPVSLHQHAVYVGGVLFFFISTMFVVTYLATGTTNRLRKREAEVIELSEDLQRAYSRLQTLYESAQTISATLELQQVLNQLAQETAKGMNVQACSIRLLDKMGTRLHVVAVHGLSEAYVQKGDLVLEHNPLARAVLSGKVIAVDDVLTDKRLQYPAEAAAEGIRAMLSVPLFGKRGPLGLIRAYSRRLNHFTKEDETFLVAIANQGSIAIENALAYQTIQNLDEAKSKFVRTATHELRSPVSVVRSLLRTLTKGYAGVLSEQQLDMIVRALKRADFLQALIDDLLDLAAGKSELREAQETEPVDLGSVVKEVVQRYSTPAQEKHIVLDLQLDPSEPPLIVLATTTGIDRIVNNLVSNAIKYTPDGGQVTVTLRSVNGNIYLEVTDSGIGIPEESLPRLFEEFYRAPNAKAIEKSGTGLGLVITKDLIIRYGGHIQVKSTVGKGTTLSVTLPLTQPSAERKEAPSC